MTNINEKINSLYLAAFLLNLHVAIPSYINSTFLGKILSDGTVGIIYSVGAIFSIWAFISLPKVLEKYGNYRIGCVALVLEFGAILCLALTQNPIFVFISFVLSLCLSRIVSFNTDIFLENLSTDGKTGLIRGVLLTSSNLAWVLSPILAAFVLERGDYLGLYILSALITIPVLVIFLTEFKNFKDPIYSRMPFWGTLKAIRTRGDVGKVFTISIMLQIFYSWMIIYTPIYLKEYIGFEWSEIGIIFTIMLLPFVLLEIPLGKMADKYLGEKELLSFGILILSCATITLSFITEPNILIWTIALFTTRIGASAIEVMTETHFFKTINISDSNLMEFFRMTGPIAYILGPILATLTLLFVDIQYMFVVLGLVMLFALKYSLTIKDSR